MIKIDDELIQGLFEKAAESERKRINYDMRTSVNDGSQRMLNALLPETVVPIHRHPMSSENVFILSGRLDEVIYEASPQPSPKGKGVHTTDPMLYGLVEVERIHLCPAEGNYGCIVPAGVWHTVEVFEPSVIYEAKDGKYGEDGSERAELQLAIDNG